jgi:trigger factor
LVEVDEVKKDEALTVTLDNGDMRIEDAYVGLISMTDEERAAFLGKKVGDKMDVNVNELYKSASQRAAILQVKEDELEGINPQFSLEITQIRQFANPELNEEFFKMAFPDGKITSEAELDKYLNDEVEMEMGREADYLFTIRVRNFLMEKAALQMPEAFLKRWLYTINEGKFSMEDIEKDFDAFLKMFTWNYIQKHFIQTYELTVSPEEIEAEAKEFAKAQFAQYGMPSAPEEMITNFSKQILENKEQAQKIYEKLYELKVVEYVKSKIKVTNKSVTSEEFAKLAQEM